MPYLRQTIVYGGLLATLAATAWIWLSEGNDQVVEPAVKQQASSSGSVPASAEANGAVYAAASVASSGKNLFPTPDSGTISPESHLPTQASSSPAAEGTAPALPFEFLGRQQSKADTYVFISFQDRTLSLKEGDTVDSLYRLKHIRTKSIEWVYLPSNEMIVMNIEGEQP